jgi:glycosyltransferase involved in cell wall biosynthesis
MKSLPSLTIVTPSFNQGRYIRETIESVLRQEYPDAHHIVCDAGSTDNTVDILKSYPHLQWVSERDAGQSDAINKGFRMADGEIVAWINSDDTYVNGAFLKAGTFLRDHPEIDVLYGDCYMTNEQGNILRVRREIDFDPKVLLYGFNFIPQPSTFFRRSVVQRAGDLDIGLRYSMDYEYFLRLWHIGARFYHVKEFFSYYRLQPDSVTFKRPPGMVSEYASFRRKYIVNALTLNPMVLTMLNKWYRVKRQLLKVKQGALPDLWSFDLEIKFRKLLKRI